MSTHTLEEHGSDETHPLGGETTPEIVPASWLENARDEPVASGETRYYATLYTVEHELASDVDVLAGRADGRGEEWRIHVLYVRADGHRRVERSYPARVIEDDGGVRVEPRAGIAASIAVDGDVVTPECRPRTESVVAALESRHHITVSGDGG